MLLLLHSFLISLSEMSVALKSAVYIHLSFPHGVPESSDTPVKTTDFAIYGKSSAGKETDLELAETYSEESPGFARQRQAKVFLSHTIHEPLRLICFEFPMSVCTDPIIAPAALLRFLLENKPRQSAEAISRPLV